MIHTYEDICPGWRSNHKGINGICCCGLYWTNEMPCHDIHGKIVNYYRIWKRMKDRNQIQNITSQYKQTLKDPWKKLR